jgi:hypothetical protein
MENKNEIKKFLLKNKPTAEFMYIRQEKAYYKTSMLRGIVADEIKGIYELTEKVIFEIPVSDMGSADFLPEMPAQSLIRWIYSNTTVD